MKWVDILGTIGQRVVIDPQTLWPLILVIPKYLMIKLYC